MRASLPLLLAGLLAAGCAATGVGDAPRSAVGPTWQLVALGSDAALAGATITFDADGQVFGTTGCNRFFGEYEIARDGALTLSNVGSTRMACSPASMAQETRFLDAINGADRLVLRGDRLALMTGATPSLSFTSSPASTADATLSGTVTYRPRIALPPDAVVSVKLVDASRADAPSVTLAETRIGTDGAQVPFAYSLRYDAGAIQARNRYVVRAAIYDAAGILMWTTDTAYPVLTNGAATDEVEIVVVQVAEGDQASALVGRSWRLAEIRQPSGVVLRTDGDAPFSVTFGADGQYSGQADCNRYGGTFRASPQGALTLSQGLSTLAACPNPAVSTAFFGGLNSANRYVLTHSRLTLSGPSGGALVFE